MKKLTIWTSAFNLIVKVTPADADNILATFCAGRCFSVVSADDDTIVHWINPASVAALQFADVVPGWDD